MEIVHTARVDSPIGTLRVASTEDGLAYVELPHANGRGLSGWLRRVAPDAKAVEGFAPNRDAVRQLDRLRRILRSCDHLAVQWNLITVRQLHVTDARLRLSELVLQITHLVFQGLDRREQPIKVGVEVCR